MNKTKKTEWKVVPGLASFEHLDLGLLRLEVHPFHASWRVQLWAVNGGDDELCIRVDERSTIEEAKALGIAHAKAILTETSKALESVE